jgi:hypothetical protein
LNEGDKDGDKVPDDKDNVERPLTDDSARETTIVYVVEVVPSGEATVTDIVLLPTFKVIGEDAVFAATYPEIPEMEIEAVVPRRLGFIVIDLMAFGTEDVYDKIHGWKEGDKTAPEERTIPDKATALTTEIV